MELDAALNLQMTCSAKCRSRPTPPGEEMKILYSAIKGGREVSGRQEICALAQSRQEEGAEAKAAVSRQDLRAVKNHTKADQNEGGGWRDKSPSLPQRWWRR
jgi:hypothetical protein